MADTFGDVVTVCAADVAVVFEGVGIASVEMLAVGSMLPETVGRGVPLVPLGVGSAFPMVFEGELEGEGLAVFTACPISVIADEPE